MENNRNMKDMPVPEFAYSDRHDGRVFILPIEDDGKTHKRTIGHLTVSIPGEERMIPNRYFRDTYQELYAKEYPNEKIPAHQMSVGMYALTLGIATKTKLYSALQDVYGPVYANNILDYAMFSILHRSDVTQIFEKKMNREVLFSDRLRSDTWYSDFFSKKISEDKHHQFRIKWIQHLAENGLKKVWLSIDGSNNDCEARQSFLAAYGFPKSHNQNKTIVGYMYIVDAQTGCPVTYFVYEGNVPDSQAFQKAAVFLKSFHIEIEGIILDRGFAVDSVFEEIESNHWQYVIMLPGDVRGHTQMVKEYSETIRWKSEYVLENEALFGIADSKQLFGTCSRVSRICLFFDGAGGSLQSVRLVRKIQEVRKKALAAIANGSRASIDKKLEKYLEITGKGPEREIVIHYDVWDTAMASKGYYSMAVSDGISPNRANQLYKMRDTSETQYAILKSQEGMHTTRVHKTEGIYSKFAVAFIASIIRYEIESACQKLALDTNPVIQGLEQISLLYSAEGKYEAVRNLSGDMKNLFAMYDTEQDDLERISREFNSRSNTAFRNPDRRLPAKKTPILQSNSHKRGKRGVKTEISQDSAEVMVSISVNSKGGRPKGKKDSKPRKPRSDKGKIRGKRINN